MAQKQPRSDVITLDEEDDNSNWDMQERRSFPRTGLTLPVDLTVVTAPDPATALDSHIQGVLCDVSRGGCAVRTNAEVGERTRCIARFPQATGRLEPDTVWAEVRRSTSVPAGVLLGLEFETPLESLRIAPFAGDPAEAPVADPRRILVVDDQAGIRGLLTRYLGEHGFEVEAASDGEEAFRSIMADPPDVMLLDLYLPRLNGHDLLRRMKDLDLSVDVVFTMSGYADTADAQECLRLGAVDHLLKPIDLEHLYRSIVLRLGVVKV